MSTTTAIGATGNTKRTVTRTETTTSATRTKVTRTGIRLTPYRRFRGRITSQARRIALGGCANVGEASNERTYDEESKVIDGMSDVYDGAENRYFSQQCP